MACFFNYKEMMNKARTKVRRRKAILALECCYYQKKSSVFGRAGKRFKSTSHGLQKPLPFKIRMSTLGTVSIPRNNRHKFNQEGSSSLWYLS